MSHRGHVPVYLYYMPEGKVVLTDDSFWVEESNDLIEEIEALLGENTVKVQDSLEVSAT